MISSFSGFNAGFERMTSAITVERSYQLGYQATNEREGVTQN